MLAGTVKPEIHIMSNHRGRMPTPAGNASMKFFDCFLGPQRTTDRRQNGRESNRVR